MSLLDGYLFWKSFYSTVISAILSIFAGGGTLSAQATDHADRGQPRLMEAETKPASDSPIHLSYHLLDNLKDAVVENAPGKKGKMFAGEHWIQPFWYSRAGKALEHLHRRLILHNGDLALRDMREVLLLPVHATASFDIPQLRSSRFVTVAAPFHTGGGAKDISISVRCKGIRNGLGNSEEVVMKVSVPSINIRSKEWPEPIEGAIPDWCSNITLEASGTKEAKGIWIAWQDPRVVYAGPQSAPPHYNVLFIVVDAMRADVVGATRNADAPSVSPKIDELEKGGTGFLQAMANGNTTLLSMNAMLMGTHPRAAGFLGIWWGKKVNRAQYYERRPTYLPLLLHDAGYLTAGATHNHMYFPGYEFGIDPGFDILQDCGRDTTDHPILTQKAIDFMSANRHHRFMLQVNLLGPHQPYAPPKECLDVVEQKLGKKKKGFYHPKYLGEVCWVDIHVGKLMQALDELDLRKNTIVVLTSDHGEIMDPKHDCFSKAMDQGCFNMHGVTLYDEELHVPIIFSLPGVVKPQVTPDTVQHVDIVPTILDLVGLPIPDSMTGRSLKDILVHGKRLPDVPIYAERWLSRAVRHKGYKLIYHTAKDDICPPSASKVCKEGVWVELYNIVKDPREREEISKKEPEITRELTQLVQQIRKELYEKSGGTGPNP